MQYRIGLATITTSDGTGIVNLRIGSASGQRLDDTPTLCRLSVTEQSSDVAVSTDLNTSIGWTDGTDEMCISQRGDDNVGTSITSRRYSAEECIHIKDSGSSNSTSRGTAVFSSWGSDNDSININVTTAFSADVRIIFEFFYLDSGTENYDMRWHTFGTSLLTATLGWEPNLLFCQQAYATSANPSGGYNKTSIELSWGCAAEDSVGTLDQSYIYLASNHNAIVETANAHMRYVDATNPGISADNGNDNVGQVATTSTTYTLARVGTSTRWATFIVAIGTVTNLKLVTGPLDTIDQTITGAGFTPGAVIMGCSSAPASDTSYTADVGSVSMGMADGFEELSIMASVEDAADPMNTRTRIQSDVLALSEDNGAPVWEISLNEFNSDGITTTAGSNSATDSTYWALFMEAEATSQTIDFGTAELVLNGPDLVTNVAQNVDFGTAELELNANNVSFGQIEGLSTSELILNAPDPILNQTLVLDPAEFILNAPSLVDDIPGSLEFPGNNKPAGLIELTEFDSETVGSFELSGDGFLRARTIRQYRADVSPEWFNDLAGPAAGLLISGDFFAYTTVKLLEEDGITTIGSSSVSGNHFAGLVAYDPDTDPTLNYVFAFRFNSTSDGSPSVETKSTVDDDSSPNTSPTSPVIPDQGIISYPVGEQDSDIAIERIGETFTFYHKAQASDTWIELRSFTRDGVAVLPETLVVGVGASSFSRWQGDDGNPSNDFGIDPDWWAPEFDYLRIIDFQDLSDSNLELNAPDPSFSIDASQSIDFGQAELVLNALNVILNQQLNIDEANLQLNALDQILNQLIILDQSQLIINAPDPAFIVEQNMGIETAELQLNAANPSLNQQVDFGTIELEVNAHDPILNQSVDFDTVELKLSAPYLIFVIDQDIELGTAELQLAASDPALNQQVDFGTIELELNAEDQSLNQSVDFGTIDLELNSADPEFTVEIISILESAEFQLNAPDPFFVVEQYLSTEDAGLEVNAPDPLFMIDQHLVLDTANIVMNGDIPGFKVYQNIDFGAAELTINGDTPGFTVYQNADFGSANLTLSAPDPFYVVIQTLDLGIANLELNAIDLSPFIDQDLNLTASELELNAEDPLFSDNSITAIPGIEVIERTQQGNIATTTYLRPPISDIVKDRPVSDNYG